MTKADAVRKIRWDQRDLLDRTVFDTKDMPPEVVAYLTSYRAAANAAGDMLFLAELKLRRHEGE